MPLSASWRTSRRAIAVVAVVLGAVSLTGCASLVGAHLVGLGDADSGGTNSGGTNSLWAFDVAAGDCLLGPPPPESDSARSPMVHPVPCTQPHRVEVYGSYRLRDQSYSVDVLGTQASTTCVAALEGRPLRTTADPKLLTISAYIPGEQSWNDFGIRAFVCYVAAKDGSDLPLAPSGAGS
jgi:hypothetical protein